MFGEVAQGVGTVAQFANAGNAAVSMALAVQCAAWTEAVGVLHRAIFPNNRPKELKC